MNNPDVGDDKLLPVYTYENPSKIYLIIGIFAILFAVWGPAISAFFFSSLNGGKEGRRYWLKKITF